MFWDLTQQIKEGFDQAGISIPYPQQDVHVKAASPAGYLASPQPTAGQVTEATEQSPGGGKVARFAAGDDGESERD